LGARLRHSRCLRLPDADMPGDRVFLFGFSRGVYTGRAVAALLHRYGLIRPGNEPLVPYAIRLMMAILRADALPLGHRDQEQREKYFDLAAQFKATMSRTECKPWFVGVCDTVSSVGWLENPLKLLTLATIQTSKSAATRSRSTNIVPFSAITFGERRIHPRQQVRSTCGRCGS